MRPCSPKRVQILEAIPKNKAPTCFQLEKKKIVYLWYHQVHLIGYLSALY